MAVGRADPPFEPAVAGGLRQADADAAGERHVAFAGEERLAGEVGGDQRSRAGGLHGQARAAQVELVGDPRRQIVVGVGDLHVERRLGRHDVSVGEQVLPQVEAALGAGEDADQPGVARRVVPRPFEGLPGAFEEQPLLRVENARLARREAEERRVEQLDPLEGGGHLQVGGIGERLGGHAGGQQLLGGEGADGLDPVAQVLPEPLEVGRAGEAPGHRDDGDLRAAAPGRR